MSASIDVTGLTTFSSGLKAAISGDLQKKLVKNIQLNQTPIEFEMHRMATSRIEQRAVGSVVYRRTAVGLDIAGGQGGGLGAALFDGGEYGGKSSKKRFYPTYTVFGRPAIAVSKRATMQFKVWLGKEGYFFWPTIRDAVKRLEKETEEIVGKALG